MSKYQSKGEVPTASVPNPPNQCNCGEPVEFISIAVYDDRGQVHTGSFSEFGYKKGNGADRRTLHLKGDYTYAHWNGVCSDCHLNQKDWRRDLLKTHFISLNIKQKDGKWREPCMDAIRRMGGFGKCVGGVK